MKKNIVKAISTWRELDVDLFNGLDIGVEIQDFVEPNLTIDEISHIIKYYLESLNGIRNLVTIHGPFLDLKPSSPDEMIREISRIKYKKTLEIANILNVNHVIFHSQINPYLNQPSLKKLNNKQASEFWHGLLEEVKDYKGIILLENIFEETPQMLHELLMEIDHHRVKINLDIGHAKLGRVDIEDWIRVLKDYISYIHIHSNNGDFDNHMSPEDHELDDLKLLLDKYDINPILSLEYKVDDLFNCVNRYDIFR